MEIATEDDLFETCVQMFAKHVNSFVGRCLLQPASHIYCSALVKSETVWALDEVFEIPQVLYLTHDCQVGFRLRYGEFGGQSS